MSSKKFWFNDPATWVQAETARLDQQMKELRQKGVINQSNEEDWRLLEKSLRQMVEKSLALVKYNEREMDEKFELLKGIDDEDFRRMALGLDNPDVKSESDFAID